MPDITKCTNEGCPIRFECYRWRAKDSLQQSFQLFEYNEDAEGNISCEMIIKINDNEQ